ncbi:LysR family transcriptional regulator [Rhizobium sp. Leaf371]|uniref:LysR family transcriptional regulator n=1 Tax=Rhizobium sp. Leaf371 TaxID=1736355 RepID=UPI000714D457|nr:LysR family transcriptional regulator [Rhizobium sp. Leaf371]KQS59441.1 LysR family transcriptional regulator [Rhizobium sp. Leaf371]
MAMEIDPRKLLYFAAIIEHGSLNRAAKLLGVSQPALTTSMARLEAEVGVQLLERSAKGIVATRSGDILYCHARLIREEIQLAERDLINASDTRSESIRIGSLPSLASKIVPMALSKWRETHTDGHLEIVENAQVDLLTGLLRRDFDFVIGYTKVFDMLDGLRQRVLFRDTLCVIAGPGHPLRAYDTLTWKDLVAFPWISPTSRRTHTVLEHIMQTMDAPLPQITVCGSVSLLKSLVTKTEHLALLPAHAVSEEVAEQRLFALPFYDPTLNRDIAVFFREGYVMDQPRRDLVACVNEIGLMLCHDKNVDR